MAELKRCPKCGANMAPISSQGLWYCLNDGTEVPIEENDKIRVDDPAIIEWRDYL